jgi:indole-3-pyruvate monooxygenase
VVPTEERCTDDRASEVGPREGFEAWSCEALVVGAGPAGLASAACLRQAGLKPLLLEASNTAGHRWKQHYERLHLHTTARWSSLPGAPFPAGTPRYPSRDQVVAYLDAYAERFAPRPHFGQRAEALERVEESWVVSTAERRYRSPLLVVATGADAVPRRPRWPGEESFRGSLTHSRAYRNAQPYKGLAVLVVGLGNTGGELSIDLHEAGARVTIAVRGPVHVQPRELLGIPAQAFGIAMAAAPNRVGDAVGRLTSWLLYRDLGSLGLRAPREGAMSALRRRGRIPLVDIGTIELLRSGAVSVRGGVDRFVDGAVLFEDGRRARFDAVILATGYEARLESLLGARAGELLDDRGRPRLHGSDCEALGAPGLFFVGFANPPSGALREIAKEARSLARQVAGRAGRR